MGQWWARVGQWWATASAGGMEVYYMKKASCEEQKLIRGGPMVGYSGPMVG